VVNTAIHLHGTSGSATATRQLVDALRQLDDVELCEVSPDSRGGRGAVRNAVSDARWDLWQASRVVPDVDLHVSPCNIGLGGPARRHLLVVYDVMVFDRPDLFDRKFASYFRLLVPPSLRRADRVLTMSEYAATRLRRLAPQTDVRVVAWPHSGGERPRVTFPERKTVLMVGATEPVKNQVAGVHAIASLRSSTGADIALRVIGPTGRAEGDVRAALACVDPQSTWTAREVDVPGEVLDAAYGSAWLLLQPSVEEGFGLPLVEAARHGLPVVHSGRGPMSEIAPDGDAGGTRQEQLASAARDLLDPARWSAAAASAVQRGRQFRPAAFRAAVRDAVRDLLPEDVR
jgi:glycosyltransferase involved in cell wall biosynthesis